MSTYGEPRQNLLDYHGRILLTLPRSAPDPGPRTPTRSASTRRSAIRNGERPAETTTNGSAGTTSVHSAGRLASSPASSKKKTRSHCQVLQRFTNSNERPDSGWNRCVTRTNSGYFPPAASRAVHGSVEQRL